MYLPTQVRDCLVLGSVASQVPGFRISQLVQALADAMREEESESTPGEVLDIFSDRYPASVHVVSADERLPSPVAEHVRRRMVTLVWMEPTEANPLRWWGLLHEDDDRSVVVGYYPSEGCGVPYCFDWEGGSTGHYVLVDMEMRKFSEVWSGDYLLN